MSLSLSFVSARLASLRHLGLALLVAMLAVSVSSVGASAYHIDTFSAGDRVQVTNAWALNVRTGPGNSYSVTDVISRGEPVTVVAGPVNGWYKVTGFDTWGIQGWSYGYYLYKVGSGSAVTPKATTTRAAAAPQRAVTQSAPAATTASASGPTYRMLATAYNGAEFNSTGYMANGERVHWGAVAVDPNVIPLGTRMYISGFGNQVFVAKDTGSAIKGYRIDIWYPTLEQARNFGSQYRTVTIIR